MAISNMKRQHGVALVMSLVLLIIMTIVGVSLVSQTALQERMSANQRLQTLAFEAASAGIAEALTFGLDRDNNWAVDASGDPRECRKTSGSWSGPWGDWNEFMKLAASDNLESGYRLIVFCLEDPKLLEDTDFEEGDIPPQLFVVSEGRVVDARDQVLSSRQIEVRIEDIAGTFGNVDPAIRIEGSPVAYSGAGGNFIVDGDGGPAIGTDGEENQENIEDAIKDQFMGNYKGGIVDSTGSEPFDDPAKLREWVLAIKEALTPDSGSDLPQACVGGNFVKGNARSGGNDPECDSSPYEALDNLELGWNDGAITYITGDLTVGPNSIAAGSGLVIVEGKICWHGNSSFEGKVIGLGGLYKMSGGGGQQAGGRTDGSVFVTKLDIPGTDDTDTALPDAWGEAELKVQGGGGHLVAYDCLNDQAQWDALKTCNLEGTWARPECNPDGTRAPGIGARKVITSWKESLGWREVPFFVNQ